MAETNIVIKATDLTKAAFKSVTGSMKSLSGELFDVKTGIGFLVGGVGFGALVKMTTDAARETLAYSKTLNINAKELGAWGFAAESMAISQEKLRDIFKDTSEKIGDAYGNNAGEAVDALNRLKLNVEDLVNLSPDEQLLRIADSLNQVGSQAEKIQILESFASDASLLLPLLEDTDGRLQDLLSTGRQFALSEEQLQKAEAARLEVDKLQAIVSNLAQTFVVELGPAMADVAGFLNENLPSAIDTTKQYTQGAIIRFYEMKAGIYDLYSGLQEFYAGITFGDLSENYRNRADEFAKKAIEANLKVSDALQAQIDILDGKTEQFKSSAGKAVLAAAGVGNGGGGLRAELDKQFAALDESLLSREERMLQHFAKLRLMADEYAITRDLPEEKHQQYLTRVNRAESQARIELAEKERQAKLNITKGMFDNLSALMSSDSRNLFEIGKVAAIASATIKGYEAVVGSYAEGAKIGGPILGGIYATTAGIAVAAQIASIQRTQFGGGGIVTNSAGGSPGVSPLPTPPAQQSQDINVTVTLQGNMSQLVTDANATAQRNDAIVT